ncbi:hypothetical protein OIU77_004440 [Salix suchowensis]|uniref:Uncharacterized protein n=1 Tax=Salix suchowensis TaxID=1278906 RepID=A0ABQ9AUH4_9ROSI|nr:hypothetical protein OIU77_004440 [Salix suchowensis]
MHGLLQLQSPRQPQPFFYSHNPNCIHWLTADHAPRSTVEREREPLFGNFELAEAEVLKLEKQQSMGQCTSRSVRLFVEVPNVQKLQCMHDARAKCGN